jgi:hypothetical protein
MKLKAPIVTKTYLLASSRCIDAVDLWTVGGVANSLEDGSFSGVCFTNNEDSELDIWDFGKILLCRHSTKFATIKTGQGGAHGEFAGIATRDRNYIAWCVDDKHFQKLMHKYCTKTADRLERSCTFMATGYLTR